MLSGMSTTPTWGMPETSVPSNPFVVCAPSVSLYAMARAISSSMKRSM